MDSGRGLDDAEGGLGSDVAILKDDLSDAFGGSGNQTRRLFQSANGVVD